MPAYFQPAATLPGVTGTPSAYLQYTTTSTNATTCTLGNCGVDTYYEWPVADDYTGLSYSRHPYLKSSNTSWYTGDAYWSANIDKAAVGGYIQRAMDVVNHRYLWHSGSGTDATTIDETWTTWTAGTVNNSTWQATLPSSVRRSRLRNLIRNRSRLLVQSNKQPVGLPGDIREERARETLRRLVGEQKYRLFLSAGFISVKSPRSGKVYQIFPGHGITKVYKKGQLIERLCVVLKGDFPPTDSLIVRYLMILNNEVDFRSRAVQHGVKGLREAAAEVIDWRPLPEVAADQQALRRLVS